MHRRTLLIAGAAALISGCERLKRQDQTSRLNSSLTGYAGAIRWGNFETAQGFARPREGAPLPLNAQVSAGVKVTGYSIRVNNVNANGDEANVSFSFTYYKGDSASVNTVNQTNVWYYDLNNKAWLLDGSLPKFR